MKEKILRWGELLNYKINQIKKVCVGDICEYYVEIGSLIITKADLDAAKLLGFRINTIEANVDLQGKFRNFVLWCTEEKGLY